MLSYHEVKKLNRKGNVIPIFKRIPADLDTPVTAFIKLAKNKKQSFLLESIEGGEKLARYSFLGYDPFLNIEGWADKVILKQHKNKKELTVPPEEFMKELFNFYQPVDREGLPRFTGGAVGYFSYDCIRWVEDLPDDNRDRFDLPEMMFGLYQNLVAFDHLKQEIIIISNILHDVSQSGLKKKYELAKKHIDEAQQKLSKNLPRLKDEKKSKTKVKALYSKDEYLAMVRKAKKYIKEGDIFQVVLSQRWQVSTERTPLEVYRRLRRINPSPYMFLLNFDEHAVIGSSPEMLVRIEDNNIETRPIAGTRPRGKNDLEDSRRISSLLKDKKELAEHTMLLDLGRNDLGRVAKAGSVKVKDNMIIEKYSHVIHIVSSVVGKMKPKAKPLDGFFACFPAGTVSGAPKIRAMEIIDELEKEKRSVYAGAIAYLDFWGNVDSCIAIRTVVHADDKYYVQAGGGIVADSKPQNEFNETKAKAGVLIEAITGEDAK